MQAFSVGHQQNLYIEIPISKTAMISDKGNAPKNWLFLVAVGIGGLIILGTSGVTFAYGDDNVTVEVSIGQLSEITVSPSIINWSDILPGTAAGTVTVDVQNTGSSNISNMYAYVTTITNETDRPYGSSYAGDYSAGAVVTFRNETTSTYYWAGRVEWNWTESIANTDRSAVDDPVGEGFLRNASAAFYWTIGNGSGSPTLGQCNDSLAQFAIEDDADNGTIESRTPSISGVTRNGGDTNFSYFSITRAGHFLDGTCVAVGWECDKVYFYNFDRRSGAFNGSICSNVNWITAGPMAPNDIEKLTADAWIPKGVPEGTMKPATWTFVVT